MLLPVFASIVCLPCQTIMNAVASLTRRLIQFAALSFMAASPCCIGAMNLLTDPGFENGTTSTNSIGGWFLYNNATFSQDYSHTGAWSVKVACDDQDYSWRDDAIQSVPATNGVACWVSGWVYVPKQLSFNAVGALRVNFIGTNNTWILLEPFLGVTSAVGQWTYASALYIAPPDTTYIEVMAELWEGSPGDVVYFDDLQITMEPPIVLNQATLTNGVFYFSFTNTPASNFSVLASDDLGLSTANWVKIGSPTETQPGYYEFSEVCPSNNPQRFYQVSSP